MARIHVLPQAVADRIAAGEVVERPAAVLRELLDNALDADAGRVDVELLAGGRDLVSVADDGCGLARDDALLAFERHATSKILTGEDLDHIATLGFRGEALAAIAAVSRVEMITRFKDEEGATRIEIDRGRLGGVTASSRAIGTTLTVHELFAGIPARRKFLKTPGTELNHCLRVLRRVALGRPSLAIRARQGSKTVFSAVPASSGERVRSILAPHARVDLLEIQHEVGEFHLKAWAGRSDLHRHDREGIHLFVNRRPVRDPLLMRAVTDAYRNRVPSGRFPILALFLELPAEDVDVNVHPAKSELRFHRPRELRALVVGSLEKALGTREAIPEFDARGMSGSLSAAAPSPSSLGGSSAWQATMPLAATAAEAGFPSSAGTEIGMPRGSTAARGPIVLAQFRNTFILVEDEQGLLIVDQHVAHERMNYEALLAEADAGGIARQALVFPRPLELTPRQIELVEEHGKALERLGFGIELFGPETVMVREIPAKLGQESRPETLLPILDSLDRGDLAGAKDLFDHLIATVACHASVKKGYPLSHEKLAYLLKGLDACESPSHCPHGRVISLRIDLDRINRNFDRS